MENRNVTLRLPEETIRRARHLAVERGVSLSKLLSEHLEQVVFDDEHGAEAKQRVIRRMKRGLDLGTKGRARWSREDLHER